jgi:hypothetical protein
MPIVITPVCAIAAVAIAFIGCTDVGVLKYHTGRDRSATE